MKRNALMFALVLLALVGGLLALNALIPPIPVAQGASPANHFLQATLTPPPVAQGVNPTPAPTSTSTPPTTNIQINIGTQQFWLVLALLAVLLVVFIFMFLLSHRLDNTSYLGQLYKEAVEDSERERLRAPHKVKWFTLDRNGNNGYDNDVYQDPK